MIRSLTTLATARARRWVLCGVQPAELASGLPLVPLRTAGGFKAQSPHWPAASGSVGWHTTNPNLMELLKDRTKSELAFYSEPRNEIYRASQIPELDDDLLHGLISEVLAQQTSVGAVIEEINARIAAKIDDHDLHWERRVRHKHKALGRFAHLLDREACKRSNLKQIAAKNQNSDHNLIAQVESLRRKLAKQKKHAEHQELLKKFEYTKRRFFYSFICQKIGDDLFAELMDRAGELATEELAINPQEIGK